MPTRATLQGETVTALKRRAKAAKIKGYVKMKKAALVSALATSSGGKRKSIQPRITALVKSGTRESLYRKAKAIAAKQGIKGYSTLDKRGLASFIAKAEAGKLKPKVTQASVREKMAEKKASTRRRYGKGAFRVILVKDGAAYGDLGPYATTRAAIMDGKRLLRMMVGDDYKLSQAAGEEYVGEKAGGGTGVAGIIAVAKGDAPEVDSSAMIVKVKGLEIGRVDVIPPDLLPVGYGTVLRLNRGRRRNSRGAPAKARIIETARFDNKFGTSFVYHLVSRVGERGWISGRDLDEVNEYTQSGRPVIELIKDARSLGKRRNSRGRRRNSRGAPADSVAARELALFTENDGTLYRQAQSIITNLAKKMAKGQFNRTKAVKAMGYLADSGGRKYMKDMGDPVRGPWHSYPMAKVSRVFSPATRRAAAAILLDGYMEDIEDEAASMGGKRRNGLFGRGARGASAGVSGRFGRGGRSVSTSRNPRVSFQTKDGPVNFMAKSKRNGSLGIRKAGSRWQITGPAGVLVGGIKRKRDAQSIIGEIETYRRYAGRDHMGRKINGFDVGGRYGYYAVDERDRGARPGSGVTRTVAADLTRESARDLAQVLNATLR